MKDLTLEINGESISCRQGTSILEAALDHGIEIPNLCHHPGLKPFGACRLCIVEDERSGKITASCVTPVEQDMKVLTDTPRVIRHRKNIVRLLMAEHPESCIVCSKGNRCKLREIAAQLGIGYSGLYPMPNYKEFEQANPFISRDLSKCILCGKCIRADQELVVAGAIDYNFRGFKSRPATLFDRGLEKSSCTFCGTCLSICPTGALSLRNNRFAGTPQRERLSICGFCSVGCSIMLGETSGQVVEVNPAHLNQSVNGSTLCVRGHFAHDFLNTPKRLLNPMVREKDEWNVSTWDEALESVKDKLIQIKRVHGPQSIGILGSGRCTNEENYLLQKMARVLLGTNNLDSACSSYGLRPAFRHMDNVVGRTFISPRVKDLDETGCVFVLGSNPTHSVPVVSYSVKRALKRGIPVIVADPRPSETASFASLWLPVKPKGDLELINGLAHMMIENHTYNKSFIDLYTAGFDSYLEELDKLDLNKIQSATGLEKEFMELAAELLHDKKITFIIGNGVLKQDNSGHILDAVLNLCLLTGSVRDNQGGIMPVVGENNVMGAWAMGMVPDALPGNMPIMDSTARKKWEDLWGVKLSPDPGLNILKMVEEAEKGTLKALYIMGENPLRSLPQRERVRRALEKLEFVVVQDIVENESSSAAHILLPGAPFSEKDGSFTNMEGRIQGFERVVPCKGDSMADWEILDLLCVKLGNKRRYGSVQSIRAEISKLVPLFGGINNPQSSPINEEPNVSNTFNYEKKGSLISFRPVASSELQGGNSEYPFTALIGTTRFHSGSGTRTGLSKRMNDFGMRGDIELSPLDAEKLNVKEGEKVKMSSRHGYIIREAKFQKGLDKGLAFVPLGFNGNDAMKLVSLEGSLRKDGDDHKQCAVRIEKA